MHIFEADAFPRRALALRQLMLKPRSVSESIPMPLSNTVTAMSLPDFSIVTSTVPFPPLRTDAVMHRILDKRLNGQLQNKRFRQVLLQVYLQVDPAVKPYLDQMKIIVQVLQFPLNGHPLFAESITYSSWLDKAVNHIRHLHGIVCYGAHTDHFQCIV